MERLMFLPAGHIHLPGSYLYPALRTYHGSRKVTVYKITVVVQFKSYEMYHYKTLSSKILIYPNCSKLLTDIVQFTHK